MYLHADGKPHGITESIVGKLTTVPIQEVSGRLDYIAYLQPQNLARFGDDFVGYAGLFGPSEIDLDCPAHLPRILGCKNLEYLGDGDVLLLLPTGRVNVLYRKSSPHNSILTTERCNSLCLMCSQPPRAIDDSYRVKEILRLAELIDPACKEIGITGGEPTLLSEDFLRIIQKFKDCLPNTALHVLTNGRLFKTKGFAANLGAIKHNDLMLGIPVYSDLDYQHDYVVQARGAFDETVLGLYNLAESEVAVEIRVVIH